MEASRAPPIVLDDDEDEFANGAMVLLEGLKGAAHLNGEVALVQRYVPEKNRYEVALRRGGDVKAVQSANLAHLPVAEEVRLWCDELSRGGLRPTEARPALARLGVLPVTVEVLQATRVGKVVNEMAKRLSTHSDVAGFGKMLVRRWRDVFLQKQAERPGAAGGGAVAPAAAGRPRPPERSDVTSTKASLWQLPKPPDPKPTPRAEPIARADDAAQLVHAMCNAQSDSQRAEALAALDRTPSDKLALFVSSKGLVVLNTLLRSGSGCRSACLATLQKLPVTTQNLQEAHILETVSAIARADASSDDGQRAGMILEAWHAQAVPMPEPKRPRIGEMPVVEVLSSAEQAATVDGTDCHGSDPDGKLALRLPKKCPPELMNLDPRIAKVLLERPLILDFLSKHRSVMQNLTAESIAFLARNLRNSKDTLEEDAQPKATAFSRMVTISNLHPEVTEDDIFSLFGEFGLSAEEVTIPRESRKQRSCCIAFALLPFQKDVHAAIRRLQGVIMRGCAILVEAADGDAGNAPATRDPTRNGKSERSAPDAWPPIGGGSSRIKWRSDEELWHVALFDKNESVVEFQERIATSEAPVGLRMAPAPESSARFQAAAKREHAEERKLVREALASHTGVHI